MDAVLNRPVLVLNRLWQPVQTCSVRRALKLLCLGHAQVVQTEGEAKYQTHTLTSWVEHSLSSVSHLADEVIHSVKVALVVPKIIVLGAYDRMPRNEVKFTRHNVFLRDQFTCQYCHQRFSEKDLNLDHVFPRDKGGQTTWENIVTSCIRCNTRKANKLPHETNMRPLREPKRPRWRPLFGSKADGKAHQSWEQFIQPDKERVQMVN
ncbi:HNH endonuclease [Roseibacillus ishigakijimensis]|uniref:HNH endonuclease n=1 Tax=Roseibacillus ishigakijimensis TaxID=454146 RepID=A0A934RT46_9BACT|nr:HNH endonuclease [Roseibacillus ishigakijimensis]MBK1834021.1 HNH endonuclease [Roseibacillus ishigakijimensis]